MRSMPDWERINRRLTEFGLSVPGGSGARPVGGGDINAAWRLDTSSGPVFVKTGATDALSMFEAEAEGLAELASAAALRVPDVLGSGVAGNTAFLILEWLDITAPTADTETLLGEQLAETHRHQQERFGWRRDNTIGRTPQINTPADDWLEFFATRRLRYQLDLAARGGYAGELSRKGAQLIERLPELFLGYTPVASLLHGDLWGGNWASVGGEPVVFDPAVYYGDRESDLAMTRLFGGFSASFYEAYEATWPLADGHERRNSLYQLYHVLNHLNLFGRGYLGRALALIDQLL